MYSVIASDGKTYGPVDVPTLRLWCAEGRVTANTNIIDAVSGRTMRAADLQELFDLFSSPQPWAPSSSTGAPTMTTSPPGPQQGYGAYNQPSSPYSPGYNQPGSSPYLRAPQYGVPALGSKNKVLAAVLACPFLIGALGFHRLYLGYTGTFVAMLLLTLLSFFTCGITGVAAWIWALVDFIQILVGNMKDSQGYDLA